jgi:hypothetical protein
MSAEPGQHEGRPDINLIILSLLWTITVLIIFVVTCSYYARESEDLEWFYVALILGLPFLQVVTVILLLRRDSDFWGKGALVLLPALGLEVALWSAFTFKEKCADWLGVAAVAGLVYALILGAVVFGVTGLIMGIANGRRGMKFKKLLREEPFLVVCFFLTIFTFITVFLSLSLALHDQDLRLNHHHLALYSEDVGPVSFYDGDNPYNEQSKDEEKGQANSEGQVAESFRILFAKGSAAVEVDNGKSDFREGQDSAEARKIENATNLDELTDEIVKQSQKGGVRVVLAGYSDDLPVSGSYKSNFELSLARISQVIVNLVSRLEKKDAQREWGRSIEWLPLPSASEQGFFDGGKRIGDERLSVEVVLLRSDGDRGKNLCLLDYIYFGVYTITTTGYGDIIPISAYAKFITTVANFFEIFLIVVFFNVLLSFLREEHEPAKARAAEEGKAAA